MTPLRLPVLSLLVASLLLAGCGGATEPDPDPASAGAEETPTEPTEPTEPAGWRTEVWHRVQLEVPDDWALGYSPVQEGADVLACGIGPVEWAGAPPEAPYVGRPGHGSDDCDGTEDLEVPTQDFVWFGSPLEVGESGTAERPVSTVQVGAERVTVAAAPGVVERVVSSAEQVDVDAHGCPASGKPQTGFPVEGYGKNLSMSVCFYQAVGEAPPARMWTAQVGAAKADALVKSVALGRRARCGSDGDVPGQQLLLRVSAEDDFGDEPLTRDYLVRLGECASVEDLSKRDVLGPEPVVLDPRVLRPWALDGISAYVAAGPMPPGVVDAFKPDLG